MSKGLSYLEIPFLLHGYTFSLVTLLQSLVVSVPSDMLPTKGIKVMEAGRTPSITKDADEESICPSLLTVAIPLSPCHPDPFSQSPPKSVLLSSQ